MDVLSQLLDPLEVRGAVFCFGPVQAPWCFEGGVADRALFHAVLEGNAWLTLPESEPRRLREGDVLLLPRGGVHKMGSERRQRAVPLKEAIVKNGAFGRFAIGGDGARTVLVCGVFQVDGIETHPLLAALPDIIVVNAHVGRWLGPTLSALEHYLNGEDPGAALITRRLTEILFVQTIASWLEGQDAPEGLLGALRDPRIGRALGLIHAAPARAWSVSELGRAVGMSRSALFARFRSLVGEPPLQYLINLRMMLAARALARGQGSIAEIASDVGYASLPSFFKTFRAHHGVTPNVYRASQTNSG